MKVTNNNKKKKINFCKKTIMYNVRKIMFLFHVVVVWQCIWNCRLYWLHFLLSIFLCIIIIIIIISIALLNVLLEKDALEDIEVFLLLLLLLLVTLGVLFVVAHLQRRKYIRKKANKFHKFSVIFISISKRSIVTSCRRLVWDDI